MGQAMLTTTEIPQAAKIRTRVRALLLSDRIDTANLEKDVPELTSLEVPPRLDPHPVYGIAVLSGKPAALRLALFLVSETGQAIIARAGLLPIAPLPAEASR